MGKGNFRRLSDFKFDIIIRGGRMVEGDVSCEGNVSVNCVFNGIVNSRGVVFVGKQGQIEADIRCFALIIEGKVKGRIIATNKIEVRKTGILSGDIKCDMLAIEENSFVTGSIESTRGDKPVIKKYKEKRKELL